MTQPVSTSEPAAYRIQLDMDHSTHDPIIVPGGASAHDMADAIVAELKSDGGYDDLDVRVDVEAGTASIRSAVDGVAYGTATIAAARPPMRAEIAPAEDDGIDLDVTAGAEHATRVQAEANALTDDDEPVEQVPPTIADLTAAGWRLDNRHDFCSPDGTTYELHRDLLVAEVTIGETSNAVVLGGLDLDQVAAVVTAATGDTTIAEALPADEQRMAANDIRAYIRLCGHRIDAGHPYHAIAAKLAKGGEGLIAEPAEPNHRTELANRLRQLAADIAAGDLPLPDHKLEVCGILDSREDLEQWAQHLGVDIRLSGQIPVVDKVTEVGSGVPALAVHFQSPAEPDPEMAALQARIAELEAQVAGGEGR